MPNTMANHAIRPKKFYSLNFMLYQFFERNGGSEAL